MSRAFIIGVGMTKFEKPGSRDWEFNDMVTEALGKALDDAGLTYEQIERAAAGYVFHSSTSGQRALYDTGLTGIPVMNVNNNCATGSSAVMMAREWVMAGTVNVALAVGFEKMQKGSLGGGGDMPKVTTVDAHLKALTTKFGWEKAPMTAQIFGAAAREYMEKYGATKEQIAAVAVKNHKHSTNNPYAQFQDEYALEQILDDKMVYEPLTRTQCSPTSDGAAAAIIVSEKFVRDNGLEDQAIEIVGQALTTDTNDSFDEGNMIKVVGQPMTRAAGEQALSEAGLTIDDVDVVELHDCFSINEIITYEALGIAEEGKGAELAASGGTTYGGNIVVNPSGGLISKGHPLGATGVAQITEITWHLRGMAGDRQVEGAQVGLQHNVGLGGACVVSVLKAGTLK